MSGTAVSFSDASTDAFACSSSLAPASCMGVSTLTRKPATAASANRLIDAPSTRVNWRIASQPSSSAPMANAANTFTSSSLKAGSSSGGSGNPIASTARSRYSGESPVRALICARV
jgi:hypothetical protein